MKITDFGQFKAEGRKISMLTCYDFWTANIIEQSSIDCLLVGDSLNMVMHGQDSTVTASMEMMELHVRAVSRGAPSKFIVGDMPFLSNRGSLDRSVDNVLALMQAGAHAVKIEGVKGNESLIRHLVDSGVPVMGHLGLMPQSVNTLGGYKVQGKDQQQAADITEQALQAQQLGCFSMVLECVPESLGKSLSQSLDIPVIGIGAGVDTDGQVLVMQDMLGAFDRKAKFVRTYCNLQQILKTSFDSFDQDVKSQQYPNADESYRS